MSVFDRESPMVALGGTPPAPGGLLGALVPGTFAYFSRRFLPWEQLTKLTTAASGPIKQPALFLYSGHGFADSGIDTITQESRGRPAKLLMRRTIVYYAQLPGAGTPGGIDMTTPFDTVVNPLTKAIEAALAPTSINDLGQNVQTLGLATVSHCWIAGHGFIMSGEIDPNGQGMVTIPIEILVTALS
jgi:hypothetical protein